FTRGNCRSGDRSDLLGDDVGERGRDQFAGDGDRGRYLPTVHQAERARSSLPDGVAVGDIVLGHLRRGLRAIRVAVGVADRGGEHGGFVVLRFAAGLLRDRIWLPASARYGGVRRDDRGRSGDSGDSVLHQRVVPLVQRDRLRGGGGDDACDVGGARATVGERVRADRIAGPTQRVGRTARLLSWRLHDRRDSGWQIPYGPAAWRGRDGQRLSGDASWHDAGRGGESHRA